MSTSPWSQFGMIGAGAGNALAATMLVVGWVLVDRGGDLGSQVAWLNLSIAGLGVALWVNVRWLLDGRRAIGVGMHRLAGAPIGRLEPAPAVALAADRPTSDEFVAGADLRRFHRSSCPLTEGKVWEAASPAAHRAAGRAPCGVCRP